MLSRRQLLKHSGLVSLSAFAPSALCSAARAAATESDAQTLVVIQLDGGNDGLNTVVPYADDAYARMRPTLRIDRGRVLKLNDRVGLHPSMRAAKELFDDGRLAIVQGVSYPNPDRSHFRSMRIWQTASFSAAASNEFGWLGRAMDRRAVPVANSDAALVFVGEEQTPVALWARRAAASSLSRLEDLTLDDPDIARRTTASTSAPPEGGAASVEQFVTRQVFSSYAAAENLELKRRAVVGRQAAGYPPTPLAARLKIVSQLLQVDAQARVYYTLHGGYDTHAAQAFTHGNLLAEFAEAVSAFLDDLKTARLDDRVVVLAFSEFGRRAEENSSRGTDHGTAGPVLLFGAVRGGLLGEPSDLTNLDRGDLRWSCDFRRVYATLLDDWLGTPSKEILGQSFDTLPIV